MKTNLIKLVCVLALAGAATTAPAQSVLQDLFDNNGFTTQLTPPYVGSMTLTYDGAPLAPNTTNMLTAIPNYQFAISITGTNGNTYTFDNVSLAAGSPNLSTIEIIPLASGGFLFSNTQSTPGNSYGGSADFVNLDGAFLTTAPPAFFSGFPDAIANGYSFYVMGTGSGPGMTQLAMGDYGSGIAPVPEPATVALAGLGVLGCLLMFWDRKSRD